MSESDKENMTKEEFLEKRMEDPSTDPKTPAKKPEKKKRAKPVKKEEGAEEAEGEKKGKKTAAKKKPMSNLQRKKMDDRFYLNGKGRYVSKKKSENGKRNVQSRAIKAARDLLGLQGKMILLGKGPQGKALVELTRQIRSSLKEGMEDEKAKILHTDLSKKMLEDIEKAMKEAAKQQGVDK